MVTYVVLDDVDGSLVSVEAERDGTERGRGREKEVSSTLEVEMDGTEVGREEKQERTYERVWMVVVEVLRGLLLL